MAPRIVDNPLVPVIVLESDDENDRLFPFNRQMRDQGWALGPVTSYGLMSCQACRDSKIVCMAPLGRDFLPVRPCEHCAQSGQSNGAQAQACMADMQPADDLPPPPPFDFSSIGLANPKSTATDKNQPKKKTKPSKTKARPAATTEERAAAVRRMLYPDGQRREIEWAAWNEYLQEHFLDSENWGEIRRSGRSDVSKMCAKEKALQAEQEQISARLAAIAVERNTLSASLRAQREESQRTEEAWEAFMREHDVKCEIQSKRKLAYDFAHGNSTDLSWTINPPPGYEEAAKVARRTKAPLIEFGEERGKE